MSNITASKTSWNAGILSPLLSGRFNIDQYASGGEIIQNFIPLLQGPLLKRPGTAHVLVAPGPEYMVEFKFNNKIQYILGFGDRYVRFYNRAGFVETTPGSGIPYQVTTPYPLTDLVDADGAFVLQYDQSGDVLYLVHPLYQPRLLTRIANNNWTLTVQPITDGPFEPLNTSGVTVNVSAATGTVTVTASAPIFSASDVSRLLQVFVPNNNTFVPWTPGTGYPPGSAVESNGKTYITAAGGTSGGVAPRHTIGIARDGNTNVIWEYLHSGNGYIQIQNVINATTVTGLVIRRVPDQAVNYGNTNWAFGSFSNSRGWPSHVAFYRDRLVYLRGIDVFMSVSGEYNNFAELDINGLVVADRAINAQLQGGQLNKVSWVKGGEVLLVGTLGCEYSIGPENQNQPFGPNNAKIVQKSAYGGLSIRPALLQNQILYVQRSGRRIREVFQNYEVGYNNIDLSKLSIGTVDSNIMAIAYQEEPYQSLWIALRNGRLLGITYDKSEGVYGWHSHIIGGTDIANGQGVISIGVITTPTGDKDELWMCVRRGNTYTIEVMQPGWIGDIPLQNSYFSDSSVTYSGPAATIITGLTHLEGKTVQILADGGVHPTRVVTAGTITLQRPASFVIIGIPYVSRAVTNRFEGGNPDGTSQGLTKRIVNISLRLLASSGGRVGLYKGRSLEELIYRTPQNQMDKAPPLFTGDFPKLDFRGGYDTAAQVEIVHDTPTPFCVNLITVQMEVSDR